MTDAAGRPASHGAVLTIDLGALAANWRALRDRALPAECAANVKANAYGAGIERAVHVLAGAGCKTFFVAHLGEAARARGVAPHTTIYVLNGLPNGGCADYQAIGARPVIGSPEELAEWTALGGGAAYAMQADTGMHRLGFAPDEAMRAISAMSQNAKPALLMSHFISSEEPDSPLNRSQLNAFNNIRERLPGVAASLSNSSGLFLSPQPLFDMVRPGYALYGGNPIPGQPNPMQPVMKLTAPIIQTHRIKAGDTVGYNAQWTARRDSFIAAISAGYADGWLRAHSATDARPGGEALVGGVICPFAGRVSMDLITIDVTDAPEAARRRGQTVTLIGGELNIDRAGARGGSIGYEVLTGLGPRYQREYTGG